MKYHILLSLSVLSMVAPIATAATIPTMNQPDNGFYEGPSPEWAVLHSTSVHGTEAHRQYHRDAAHDLLSWLTQHQAERGTTAYNDAHRVIVQDRNTLHRQFHTINPDSQ